MKNGRDEWLLDAMKNECSYCPAEPLDSESPLFLLYTSGSTGPSSHYLSLSQSRIESPDLFILLVGKPKGLMHTQAGYLLFTMLSHRLVFDIRPVCSLFYIALLCWSILLTLLVYLVDVVG